MILTSHFLSDFRWSGWSQKGKPTWSRARLLGSKLCESVGGTWQISWNLLRWIFYSDCVSTSFNRGNPAQQLSAITLHCVCVWVWMLIKVIIVSSWVSRQWYPLLRINLYRDTVKLKGLYRGKFFSLFSACFCRYMPLKSTQKVVLTKTYFSKR